MQLALILIIILSAIATFGLKWDETEILETENWRWALYKRRIQRWFIYKAWQAYIPNLRWLFLLLVALITYCLIRDNLKGQDFNLTKLAKLEYAGDATLFLALIGAPIAYVIWWFRDANARQQIENQRKDVNLKDFQRLAEWAAGMHLPENKITTSEKEIKAKTNVSNETLISTETSAIPTSTVIHTPSRREGAASLQIAAIYQLQAFLQGEYGRYFQRPAFQLLKSIWLALVSQHLEKIEYIYDLDKISTPKDIKAIKQKLISWRMELTSITNSPLGRTINVAFGTQQGWLLRTHKGDLPNAVFTGYNSLLAALTQPLELDGLDLRGVQFQGANLSSARLQNANLKWAKLQVTYMSRALLQGANLEEANLQGADLSRAQLQGTNLKGAKLQATDLSRTQFQDANFSQTSLKSADLSWSKLQGAKFNEALLQSVNLCNIEINEHTEFKNCKVDNNTLILVVICNNKDNIIEPIETLQLRERLQVQGLVLPDALYLQLFAKPQEYKFKNKEGKVESRNDLGLFSSF